MQMNWLKLGKLTAYKYIQHNNSLDHDWNSTFFVYSLHPSQQFFSRVETALPGLN